MDLDNLPSDNDSTESPEDTGTDELPSFDDLGLEDAVDVDNN